MLETLNHIVSVDVFTISVVGVLSAWAAIIIRQVTDSTALALVFMPVINFGALVGIYACRELDLVFSFEKDSNLIMSASVGMIFALLLMLLSTRIMYVGSAMHARAQLFKKGLEHRMTDA